MRAYAALEEKYKQNYTLVLSGGKGWLDGEIDALYQELSPKYKIIRTGYVDDADLPALLAGADLFVYPALYEGWGMPVLEAMACGTPVVCGDNTSLPEVAGDAGLMVNVRETKAITRAIEKVLSDQKLARRMAEKGLAHAQKFTWTEEAGKLVEVFKQLRSRA
jgi:glycosyltransferase involved in cell wall biosynthesis